MELMEITIKMESLEIIRRQKLIHSNFEEAVPLSPRVTRSRRSSSTEAAKPLSPIAPLTTTRLSRKNQKKEDNVEKIYLDKKVKILHKNLETIYEDPISKKGSVLFLGTSKVKRSLYLDREFRVTNKQKSKLRKSKIKRLGKKVTKCKISDDEFKKKMLSIDCYINGENDHVSDNETNGDLSNISSSDSINEMIEENEVVLNGNCNEMIEEES